MERQTCADSGVALVKKLRYRSANVSTTGSCISIVTASSSLSTFALCASFMLPGDSKRHHVNLERINFSPAVRATPIAEYLPKNLLSTDWQRLPFNVTEISKVSA